MQKRILIRLLGLALLLDAAAGLGILLILPAPHPVRSLGWLILSPALLLCLAALLALVLCGGAALRLRFRLARNGPFPRQLPPGETKLSPPLLADLARRSTYFVPRDEDYRALTGAPPREAREGTASPPAGKP